jgi:hypothetical protein
MAPDQRVRQFPDAMTEWEQATFPLIATGHLRDDFDRIKAEARRSLQIIFEQHLSPKGRGKERFGKRLVGAMPYVSDPPQYEMDIESSEAGPKSSLVYVRTSPRRDPSWRYRLSVIIDASGEAWIDDLRRCVARAGQLLGEWTKPLC